MTTPLDPSRDWPPLAETLRTLSLASTTLHPDDIVRRARRAVEASVDELVVYVADLGQRMLMPLQARHGADLEPLPIDGTEAGRAYRTERPVVGPSEDGGTRVWLPLLDSAERMGVVATSVHGEVTELLVSDLTAVANLVGELLANKSAYGDGIVRARRIGAMTLAAEMRWAMLPPLTFKGRNLTVSGLVEPAYEIAGDTFDYAVNGDVAHIAIFDAVGHGLEAARIANLAVGAYRHSRRHDLDLVGTYAAIDAAVAHQFGDGSFATAQLGELALSSGRLHWVNAGHPAPMVLRGTTTFDLPSDRGLPVGLARLAGHRPVTVAEAVLDPGDRVLFFTDGITEARSAGGDLFGRDRLAAMLVESAISEPTAAETLRLLGRAVLDHQRDVLQDDATMIMLTWQGPPEAPRRD